MPVMGGNVPGGLNSTVVPMASPVANPKRHPWYRSTRSDSAFRAIIVLVSFASFTCSLTHLSGFLCFEFVRMV